MFGNLYKNAHPGQRGNYHRCVEGAELTEKACRTTTTGEKGFWRIENFMIPQERSHYENARQHTPEIFTDVPKDEDEEPSRDKTDL